MTAPIVGPIAPLSNLPINAQYYQPSLFQISDISLGVTTTVTTSTDHNFVVGQLCRMIIPMGFGTRQLNEQQALVISIPESDEVQLLIDSQNFDAFTTVATGTQAQIFSIGDTNNGQINTQSTSQVTYIPGSFINISPN